MSQNTGDKREDLQISLQLFAELHPEQRNTADQMQAFLHSHTDCFKRSCKPGHFTGSAWLINPAGDKVLLTLHHKLQRWMQTGGHADGNPDTLEVALREAEEESGILNIKAVTTGIFDIDIHLIPENTTKGEPAHYHYDVRYLLQAPHEAFNISSESDDLRWWSKEDFTNRQAELDASVIRMAERYFGT